MLSNLRFFTENGLFEINEVNRMDLEQLRLEVRLGSPKAVFGKFIEVSLHEKRHYEPPYEETKKKVRMEEKDLHWQDECQCMPHQMQIYESNPRKMQRGYNGRIVSMSN